MKMTKKGILFVIAAVLVAVSFAFAVSATAIGDIDKNGSVSASDARFILRASVGLEELSDEQKKLADADFDGKISAADARLVLRASVGLENLEDPGEAHEHELETVITKTPACSKEGEQVTTCKSCTYKKTEILKATGHKLGEWEIHLDSTVEKEGIERRKCENCGYYTDRVLAKKTAVYYISLDLGSGNVTKKGVAADGKYSLDTPYKEGYNFKGWLDSKGEAFASSGIINGDITVYAVWELDGTDTITELVKRANAGTDVIVITDNITVDQPIFIPYETTVYSDGDFSITRAPDYTGDIFVVGSDKDGNKSVMQNRRAVLTLGGGKGTLTIDGNRDNVTVPVNGSAVFVADSSELNIYDGVRIANNNKTANDRIYQYDNIFSESALKRMGGAAVLNLSSTVNMYGGVIENNAVAIEYTETPNEDGTVSNTEDNGCGGAVYNRGAFYMYGGTISSNEALRGGAVYNDKSCYLVSGEISDNVSYTFGGAVSSSLTTTSHIIVGSDNCTEKMIIKNNRSTRAGGALYSSTKNSTLIYSNAEFIDNHSETSGGAIYTAGALVVKGATFIGNNCESSGGAIYHHYATADVNRRQLQISDSIFEENIAAQGGALTLNAGGTAADGNEGTYAEIINCEFNGNQTTVTSKSAGNGGAIYVTKNSDAIIKNCSFSKNTSVKNAGAIGVYTKATVSMSDCSFDGNTAILGGAVYISTDTVVSMAGVDFVENSAIMSEAGTGGNGGAVYYSKAKLTLKNVEFKNNSAQFNAGAIYLNSSTITLDSTCTFSGNTAGNHGGALYLTYSTAEDGTKNGSVLKAENVVFEENSALAGGAISGRSASDITLKNVSFIGNSTPEATVKTTTGGGAIYSNNSNINITNSLFDGNSSGYYGGSIRLDSCVSVIKNTEISKSTGGTGGAIYASGETLATENLVLKGNSSGLNGVLYITCREALFNNLTATENTGVYGGVLYAGRKTAVIIANSVLSSNTAKNGGALYVTADAVVQADNCQFTGNSVEKGDGGAVYVYGATFTAQNNSVFEKNTSVGYGGAIGAFDLQDETTLEKLPSSVNVTACAFAENTGDRGGAVYFNDSQYSIIDCSFTDNTATSESYGGGAVYNTGATGTISKVTFTQNKAFRGGAVALYTNSELEFSNITATGNVAEKDGGVIYSSACKVELTDENIILSGNKANNGGAVYAIKPSVFDVSGVTIENNEAENNGGALYVSGATVNISGADTVISGNKAVNYGGAIYLSYITDAESQKIGGTLNITDTELKENTALYGGAISGRTNSAINLNGVSLTENSTPDANLDNKAGGGAIYANNSQINISESEIIGNSSGYYGGAVFTEKCNVTIKDNTLINGNNGGTGAALYLTSGSSLDAKDITVTNNNSKKNGIIYLNGTEFSIVNMTASENTANSAGGVIYTSGSGNLSISDSSFNKNSVSGGSGGVLYHTAGNVTIDNVTFTENSAKTGGVIYATEKGNLTVSNSVFEKNTATGSGGSLYQAEGIIILSNTLFSENSSKNGGAVYLSYADAQLSNLTFTNNEATLSGGAAYVAATNVTATGDSIFSENSASNHGGAIYMVYIDAEEEGADGTEVNEIRIPSTLTMENGTFVGNSATGGGAVSIRSACEATFNGTVFTENTVAGYEIKADGTGSPDGNAEGGGAVYIGYGKLTFNNVTADNNEAFATAVEGTEEINKSFGGVVSSVSSQITVNGGTFSDNKASVGGAFHTMANTALTINNATLSNNESSYEKLDYDNTIGGGAINTIGGSLDIACVTLDANKTGYYGGAVMSSGTTVSITNGSTIKNSEGATGAALHFKNKCNVTIKDCEITDNISSNNGVIYANSSNLACENITATGNTAKYGGVFYVSNKNTAVTVTDSTIYSNAASVSGGVVHAENSAVTFTECALSLNTAKNGGVAYTEAGNITFTDSNIYKNNSTSSGGLAYAVSGSMTFTNCEVAYNAAKNGGAYYGDESSNLTVNKTVFTENTATSSGGAVFMTQAEALFDGAEFISNSSTGHGGAVYVAASTVSMINENSFNENSSGNHGGAIYVVYKDIVQEDNSSVRVPSVLNATGGEFIKNTALGGGAVSIRSDCEASFDGTAFIENTVSGFSDKADGNGEGGGAIYVGYGELKLENVTVTDNEAAATVTEGTGEINKSFGGVVSSVSSQITVNGGTFSGNKASVGGVFHLMAESELIVTGALIENNESDYINTEHDNSIGGGVIKAKDSTVTFDSTALSGNKSNYYGGVVHASNSTVTVRNGSKIESSEGGTGAVVYVNSTGNVTISNSEVINNTASVRGIIYSNGSTIIADELEAYGNKAHYGGVFYASGTKAYLSINNSVMHNNQATSSGGVVYAEKATVELTGGTVFDNTAKNGGVVYAEENSIITVKDAELSANTVSSVGGAIYAILSEISLDSAKFTENEATGNGGAVYLNRSTVNLSDNEFTQNVSGNHGGAAYVAATTVTATGDNIFTENSASNHGGAVYMVYVDVEEEGADGTTVNKVRIPSTLTMENGSFTENTAIGGGAVSIRSDCEATFDGTKFIANTVSGFNDKAADGNSEGGGAIYAGFASLVLKNVVADGNIAEESVNASDDSVVYGFGGFVDAMSATINIEGGTFENNMASSGGVVYALSNSDVTFMSAVLKNNESTYDHKVFDNTVGGGAVSMIDGTLTISATTLDGNKTGYYGGTLMISGTTVEIKDNSVVKNSTGKTGAAFSFKGGANITISDSSIVDNTASSNGVIYINSSELNAENLIMSGNKAARGGVVYASNSKTSINIKDSEITKNSATSGGVVYVEASELNLSGSSMTENSAAEGGVVYATEGAIVTFDSGAVSENSATKNGGAIFSVDSNVNVKDSYFSENTAKTYGGALYNKTSVVTIENTDFSSNTAGTGGGAVNNIGSDITITGDSDFAQNQASNHGGAIYVTYVAKSAEVPEAIPGSLTMTDGTFTSNSALGGGAVSIRSACEASFDGTAFIENTVSGFSDKADGNGEGGGAIYVGYGTLSLTDTVFNKNSAIETINAEDSSVNINFGGAIDSISSTITLTGGFFEGNSASIGGAIYLRTNSEATFNGTEFKDNSASNAEQGGGGGAICADSSSVVLSGVTATGNSTGFYGGVLTGVDSTISVNNGSFSENLAKTGPVFNLRGNSEVTINKVSMTDNVVSKGNGIIYATGSGSLDVTELTASGNANTNGGVFYVSGSVTLTIKDSVLSGNSATTYAGAIDFRSSKTLSVTDTIISGNTAKYGGAMNLAGKGAVEIKGCTFENNTATELGGALHITGSGKVDISEDTVFKGNSAPNAGAIYLDSGATAEIAASSFEGNSATAGDGGAIMVADTTEEGNAGTSLTLTTVTFDSNISAGFGGALHISGSANTDVSENTVFKNNSAVKAGAVYIDLGAKAEITSSSFNTNSATGGDGGAILIADSSAEGTAATSLTLNAVTFDGNKASSKGGAISTDTSSANLVINADACLFNENKSLGAGGGAVEIQNGNCTTDDGPTVNSLVFTNCKFTGNTSKTTGAAVEIRTASCAKFDGIEATGNAAGSKQNGGVFYVTSNNSRLYITGTVTQSDNTAAKGAFAYLYTVSSYSNPPRIYTSHSSSASWVSDVGGNSTSITFDVTSMP